MLGRFFNTAEVDAFADWVVEELKKTLPAANDPTLRNVADKVERMEKRISEKTRSLVQTSKLNIYTKARLAARVREGMIEFGYPEPFIKKFSMELIRRIQTTKPTSG